MIRGFVHLPKLLEGFPRARDGQGSAKPVPQIYRREPEGCPRAQQAGSKASLTWDSQVLPCLSLWPEVSYSMSLLSFPGTGLWIVKADRHRKVFQEWQSIFILRR